MEASAAELWIAGGLEVDPDDQERRDGGYEERVEKLAVG
jgi:hypothetical protein